MAPPRWVAGPDLGDADIAELLADARPRSPLRWVAVIAGSALLTVLAVVSVQGLRSPGRPAPDRPALAAATALPVTLPVIAPPPGPRPVAAARTPAAAARPGKATPATPPPRARARATRPRPNRAAPASSHDLDGPLPPSF